MIEKYVEDIRRSLENKCYFAALSLALTLPDICGSAEYPDESVTKRYVTWYDENIGKFLSRETEYDGTHNPWMSGEVVYHLKNNFVSQVSVNTDDKDEPNRYVLILGDGTTMTHLTFNAGVPKQGRYYKMMAIDVTYLCDMICNCAGWYYDANKEKFKETITIVEQKDLDMCLAMDTDESQVKMFNLMTDDGKMGREK